jgi:hypothetical protein
MRYREFELTEDELFELNMSPGNLQKMAANIDARAGMEFELIVPDVENEEQEYDSEPDYEMDESFPTGRGWQRDIIDFFRGGDMGNSTSTIQRAIDSLNEDFYAWIDEDQEEFINSIEARDRAIELAADSVDRADYESDDEYRDAVLQYADENQGDIQDQLIDEYNEDLSSKFEEWLDDQGINSMADFANEYNLDWPYWTQSEYDGGGGASIDAVADDFSQAIGRPVNAASSYHGARREAGHYVVEPDGSLSGDRGETGLEFVSPVLTVPEMLEDIDKVAKWASRVGAYTNNTTGLHMNVSVPDQQNLDYVKLAMFLGDNYILKQFGREGNTYCKSALDKIKKTAQSNPDRVEEMFRQFQGGLNKLASTLIHTGGTEKFVSINNRNNWIEFRSPGGDWLGGELDVVKNTLLRAVVALDVATKPDEFKQEYYKKLYKTLSQGTEDTSIEYFAKYAAGELPRSALKSFVRQIQQKRSASKQEPTSGDPLDMAFVWRVIGSPDSPYQSRGTEVVATSEAGALAAAVQKWNLNTSGQSIEQFTRGWRALPQRPATQQEIDAQAGSPASVNNRRYYWVYIEGNAERGVRVMAATEYAAKQIATMQHARMFVSVNFADIRTAILTTTDGTPLPGPVQDIARAQLAAQASSSNQEFSGGWEVVSRATDDVVYRFNAEEMGMSDPRSVAQAEDIADRWRQGAAFTGAVYVRPQMRAAQPVAGSTQDLQRQRLAAQMPALDTADGNWEIYNISSQNTVYRFTANTEEQAVQAFYIWQDALREPSLPREGFNLRTTPGSSNTTQQQYRVTYTGRDGTNSVTVSAPNANAAMDRVRRQFYGSDITNIEAEPASATPAQGTGSLPPGNARWLVLDRDDNEVYSFINTTAQSDANQYARDWMINRAPREVRDRGPFTIVPAR